MNLRHRRSSLFTLLVIVLAFALTVPNTSAASADRFEQAIKAGRAAVEELVESPKGPPGIGVAVLVDGRIVWADGFGFADLEQRVALWPHTKMRIGSVSKPITSAALGLLYEQNKLDLDAPVQKYVPSFPKKKYPITTRQVAGHLSGIRHYEDRTDAEVFNTRHFATVLEGLSLFKDDPLLFEPGEKFHYSSHGWNLLSAVVEGASGQDFLSYMQRNVFDAAGMRHTIADLNALIVPNRARFYVRDEQGHWKNAPYVDNSYKWAGGGFLSTPEDLVRFGWAIIGGRLLKPETVTLFTTSQRTSDGKETGYGIGWDVSTDSKGRRTIGHGGGSVGGASGLLAYPEQRVVVAIIVNTGEIPDRDKLMQRIAEGFIAAP
ncbi:MAG: serine hydrolase domain-containing protein [Bryobacterales bacterium]